MTLNDVKLNTSCVIKGIDIEEKTKIRLMELGLIRGTIIQVKRRSLLKHTLLISFNHSLFTLKDNLARGVEVNYV